MATEVEKVGKPVSGDLIGYNMGSNPLTKYRYELRVEAAISVPVRKVQAFGRPLEFEHIQEGGLNDYVHIRRKALSRPHTLVVERYAGTYYLDPLPNGAELMLPLILIVFRDNWTPARTYTFTGCTVIRKTYGELAADDSGLLVDEIEIAYREFAVLDIMPDAFQNSEKYDKTELPAKQSYRAGAGPIKKDATAPEDKAEAATVEITPPAGTTAGVYTARQAVTSAVNSLWTTRYAYWTSAKTAEKDYLVGAEKLGGTALVSVKIKTPAGNRTGIVADKGTINTAVNPRWATRYAYWTSAKTADKPYIVGAAGTPDPASTTIKLPAGNAISILSAQAAITTKVNAFWETRYGTKTEVTEPAKKIYEAKVVVEEPLTEEEAAAAEKVAAAEKARYQQTIAQKAQKYLAGAAGTPAPVAKEITVPVGNAAGILAAQAVVSTAVNALWKGRYGTKTKMTEPAKKVYEAKVVVEEPLTEEEATAARYQQVVKVTKPAKKVYEAKKPLTKEETEAAEKAAKAAAARYRRTVTVTKPAAKVYKSATTVTKPAKKVYEAKKPLTKEETEAAEKAAKAAAARYQQVVKVTKPAKKEYKNAAKAPARPTPALSPMAKQNAQKYRAGAAGTPAPGSADITVPVGNAAGMMAAQTAIAATVNPLWKARYGGVAKGTKPADKEYKSTTQVTKPTAKVYTSQAQALPAPAAKAYNRATKAPARPAPALSAMAPQNAQQYRAGADGSNPVPSNAEIKVPVGNAAGVATIQTARTAAVNPLWKARYGFWPSSSN